MLLGDILRRDVRRHGSKTALVFGDARYTYAEFNDRVNRLANGLGALGVVKGGRVAVLAKNCPQYPELYWAAAKGGFILVPLNTFLPPKDIAYVINDSEANTFVAGEEHWETVDAIRPQLETIKHLVAISGDIPAAKKYEELIASSSPSEPQVELDEEDIAYILYTSGTTGLPKGVMLSHKNMISLAVDAVLGLGLTHDDVSFGSGPNFAIGTPFQIASAFYLGATVVCLEQFTPQAAVEVIAREKATSAGMLPPQLAALLDYPERERYDLSSLRSIYYGAMPMPVETLKRAINVFGNIFVQCYALTEAMPLAFLGKEDHIVDGPEEKVRRLRSCGKEAPNIELRVVDDDGRDVAPGEVGEIIARGDTVMKGYWKLPGPTAETLRGGYLHTGDMATVDEEGYIYTFDRKKDVIVCGDNKISSREVEEIIYGHPAVAEAAVVGIPDVELGEMVKAVLVLKEGRQATAEEIIEFCQRSLPPHAVPRRVEFTSALPRNPMGKVLKRDLRGG